MFKYMQHVVMLNWQTLGANHVVTIEETEGFGHGGPLKLLD